jgi:cytochrome c556
MGAGAPGFTEQAIAFHKTADGIAVAAKSRDGNAVLSALGTTLKTCTGCHATWKQKVVDEATFGAVAPPGGMAHP